MSKHGRPCQQMTLPGRRAGATLILVMLASTAGCSTLGDMTQVDEVKPWQRGTLARDDMQLSIDAMDDAVDDHLYFSKEASTGGRGARGGGCGCN